MIFQANDITKPIRESADVCIIGSGCGGGPVAKTLAEAGKRVIVIEEGSSYAPPDFVQTEEAAFAHLYQQRAGQATDDQAILVLQGKCVGGSTTINWTTSLRTPEFVLETWARTFGVNGMSPREMEPYFERVEKYLNIHPEPDERHNHLNRLILDGGGKLGYRATTVGRNVKDCVAAGACGIGCPVGAKQSVDVTYIPDAVKAGAIVFANCRAEKIEVSGGKKRVSGNVIDPATKKSKFEFIIEAPVVVVSASSIHSPVLLLKSGLANSSGHVGRHLTFHLTTAVLGVFDHPMYPWKGIPQSAMCDEFINKKGDGGGFWIEAVPATAALAGLSMPGFGKEHREFIRNYPNIGASIILVKEIDSEGRVTVNDYGRPSISYKQGWKDLQYLKQGLKVAAEIQFAAGARAVTTLHSRRTTFDSIADIDGKLEAASWGMNEIALYSAHPLGTCRMGEDPRTSVVDSHCQSHDAKGLFVIDGSVTCTSLGVNPQVTLLAIAEKSADWLRDNFTAVAST